MQAVSCSVNSERTVLGELRSHLCMLRTTSFKSKQSLLDFAIFGSNNFPEIHVETENL
jgi:hypothetical protein